MIYEYISCIIGILLLGDDVVEEFLKDKQEEVNDGKQIEMDTHLPGMN